MQKVYKDLFVSTGMKQNKETSDGCSNSNRDFESMFTGLCLIYWSAHGAEGHRFWLNTEKNTMTALFSDNKQHQYHPVSTAGCLKL